MKTNIKNLFSVTINDIDYFIERRDKFELVSCPQNKMYCKKILPVVNREYFESDQYLINKEYRKSIELLKNAYNETCELKETSCANCAKFIRSAINQSIINIQKEENRSSKRLFGLNGNPCESLSAKLVFKEIL